MPDKEGLQLLPETRKKIELKIPGENRLLIIGAVFLVLVAVTAGSFSFYQRSLENKISALDEDIKTNEAQRDKTAENNILILNKQVGLLNRLLSDHILWTKGFGRISNDLEAQVQFKSFAVNLNENKITMRAATNSYATIARQMASFVNDESIKDVSLDGVTVLTNGTMEFSMTLAFDPAKFVRK